MQEILIQAGSFVAIILLGYALRRIGFFREEDFKTLSKIVVKITLPAAIISSFAGKEIDPAMLLLSLVGLGGGIAYILLSWFLHRKGGREKQAFTMLNTSGYNIGNFTLPFVQGFLGPMGVITTSLFDVGNAFICLGGAYGAAAVVKGGGRFSLLKILKALTKSVAFDCYIIVIAMNLLSIPMPTPVTHLAGIIGNANAFVAMLMIGIGFKLSGDRSQKKTIVQILALRYSVAAVIAVGCYFLLPFSLEVRQAMVLLAFSPIASAAPAFTVDLKGDTGLSSAVNSISILCSIVIILVLLIVML